jgi:hypothetical protein
LELTLGLGRLIPRITEVNHHIRASLGARLSQRPTNTPGRSSHQDDLVPQWKIFQAACFPGADSIIPAMWASPIWNVGFLTGTCERDSMRETGGWDGHAI